MKRLWLVNRFTAFNKLDLDTIHQHRANIKQLEHRS
jgi:hypothetical protein